MVEYYYELTGNKGKTLFEALRQSDYDRLIEGQVEHYIREAIPGRDCREPFIDEHLWERLDGDALDAIADNIPELKDKANSAIKEWLYEYKHPVIDEDDMINEWAQNRANIDAQDGFLWDHVDAGNDVDIALCFGLIKYPEYKDGKYIDNGDRNTIPAETANTIVSQKYKGPNSLEKEAVGKLILVTGFYCDIHGGKADFEVPIPKTEVLACPSCDHPICPCCANCYTNDPDTEAKAREYLESCDSVSGMAYCGNCGDYSEKFMLDFLKLVKCPIPNEYLIVSAVLPPPRYAQFVATSTVAALPDFPEIAAKVKERFDSGISGIIKIEHPSGEIWGYPERYPEGWVCTILYPEER